MDFATYTLRKDPDSRVSKYLRDSFNYILRGRSCELSLVGTNDTNSGTALTVVATLQGRFY
jgi:hypothetical protein